MLTVYTQTYCVTSNLSKYTVHLVRRTTINILLWFISLYLQCTKMILFISFICKIPVQCLLYSTWTLLCFLAYYPKCKKYSKDLDALNLKVNVEPWIRSPTWNLLGSCSCPVTQTKCAPKCFSMVKWSSHLVSKCCFEKLVGIKVQDQLSFSFRTGKWNWPGRLWAGTWMYSDPETSLFYPDIKSSEQQSAWDLGSLWGTGSVTKFLLQDCISEAGQLLWQVRLLIVNMPKTSGLDKRLLVGHQGGSRSPNVICI